MLKVALHPYYKVDFPTFIGHTIMRTRSPGRLELFGSEITK